MSRGTRRWGLVVVLLGGALGVWRYFGRSEASVPRVTSVVVTRGSVVDAVGATGTLEAVTTVQVGTQVSGVIKDLLVDYNSRVRKGQVIARLDPALFETQVEQARANLTRAQADTDRLRVTLEDARRQFERARELSAKSLIPQSELDAAEVQVRSIQAQIRSADAQVTQATASLNQAQVNLEHTIITAPIDGTVIARNVDVGQTVAATMQAPTLYVLAADLAHMQVRASVDEADVGRVAQGQRVTFRVDAFPGDEFEGHVSQVRLQATVVQNVVTYTTVIDVPNPTLRLLPGMTATVAIEIARRDDVLRVPNSALRFASSPAMLTQVGLTEAPAPLPNERSVSRPAGREGDPSAAEHADRGERRPLSRVVLDERGALLLARVATGITDGTFTEIVDGLAEGQRVATAVDTSAAETAASSATVNPFGPPSRRTAGPPGVRNVPSQGR